MTSTERLAIRHLRDTIARARDAAAEIAPGFRGLAGLYLRFVARELALVEEMAAKAEELACRE